MSHLSEEYIEAFLGQVQKHHQQRGAHDSFDLLRELQAAEAAEAAAVEFALPTRKVTRSEHPAAPADSVFSQGLALVAEAAACEGVQQAFVYARDRLPENLRRFFVQRDGCFFVSSVARSPDFNVANAAHSHTVVCWCARACAHAPGS